MDNSVKLVHKCDLCRYSFLMLLWILFPLKLCLKFVFRWLIYSKILDLEIIQKLKQLKKVRNFFFSNQKYVLVHRYVFFQLSGWRFFYRPTLKEVNQKIASDEKKSWWKRILRCVRAIGIYVPIYWGTLSIPIGSSPSWCSIQNSINDRLSLMLWRWCCLLGRVINYLLLDE